jgi:hypothetical protein
MIHYVTEAAEHVKYAVNGNPIPRTLHTTLQDFAYNVHLMTHLYFVKYVGRECTAKLRKKQWRFIKNA